MVRYHTESIFVLHR